jgi:hypothetical protein
MAEQKDTKQALLVDCFIFLSCLAYYSILKMEAMYLSEMLLDFHRTAGHYTSEERILHDHLCENLRSKIYYGKFELNSKMTTQCYREWYCVFTFWSQTTKAHHL